MLRGNIPDFDYDMHEYTIQKSLCNQDFEKRLL